MNAGETYFLLEQGMPNPRDGSVGYRPYDSYAKMSEARRASKKLPYYRITECKVLEVGGRYAREVTA